MPEPDSICTGTPRFADADLQSVLAQHGPLAAWREAVSRHGAAAASKASGEFSIALRLEDGRVFMAVDRFAVQPLCWSARQDGLHFARRADELARDAADLDPQAIFDYLYFHVIVSPRTAFRGISRLPPGHALWFEGGAAHVWRYWEPAFREPRQPDLPALKARFFQVVHDSVARQVERNGQTACFLSGGTDSSTVAGMIGRVTGRRAESYSIGFEAEGYDEMEYARIAARHFGTHHHEYYVTPADLVRAIPTAAAHFDQPFGNSSALPAFYCASLARADGARRMLAGDGGDELFGGNARYAKQRIFEAWHAIPTSLRRTALEPMLADSGVFDRIPLAKKGASYVRQARIPMPDRLQTYNLLERLGLPEVLTPRFLSQVDPDEPLRHQRETYAQSDGSSLINRMLAFDWRYTLADSDLPKVVGATELAGVRAAFPLLDSELVDFSLGLPGAYKLKGVKLRWFFKEALRGFLPDAILAKRKQGFGLPFGVWANRDAALRALAEDSLRALVGRGLLNARFVDGLFAERLASHPGYFGEIVWVAMMLEQWLRAKAPSWQVDG